MLLQYDRGRSLLHKLGPGSKFILLLCVSALAMGWNTAGWELGLLVFVVAAARLAGGMGFGRMQRTMSFLLALAVPYFVLTALAVNGEHVLWSWGLLHITSEGLNAAGAMTLRMFILFLSSLTFIITTDPQQIVQALHRRLKVPYRFAFGISLALSFLPLLEEEGRTISAAQRVRGQRPPRGWRSRLRWWGSFLTAVLVNAVRRVQMTAGAMEGKGFGAYPDRTYLHPLQGSPAGPWMAGLGVITAVLLLLWH
ncbi:energy-coupling factor transporter transmembrane component T [Paenibacillus sp. JX-17]|uniref:Energy-coupling factor transporter transmembrane component T n=1 Tax=Paenibacillus lacisoli TaxID=3064525 RepID=A0ABT9CK14_9BACL|nr:energy-coupling factor transporter transmembrane component T [Paenibacillus sp. JX-17]MDO7908277.1 energy-coupling factor transporter transmembrane component T [Paenibacillus sp. JX-17]